MLLFFQVLGACKGTTGPQHEEDHTCTENAITLIAVSGIAAVLGCSGGGSTTCAILCSETENGMYEKMIKNGVCQVSEGNGRAVLAFSSYQPTIAPPSFQDSAKAFVLSFGY